MATRDSSLNSQSTDQEKSYEDQLNDFVKMINSEDTSTLFTGIVGIRKLVSMEKNPPLNLVIDAGIVPKILELMKSNDTKIQFESTWVICNLCSGTSEMVKYVVSLGGLNISLDTLNSNESDCYHHTVWIIGNIAEDSITHRNMCLQQNCMKKLAKGLEKFKTHYDIRRTTIWTISSLLKGKPVPSWNLICEGIPILKEAIMDSKENQILSDALWAFSFISEKYVEEIISIGMIPHIVKYLDHNVLSVLVPALRIVGNIAAGNETQLNALLAHPDFLSRLFALVFHKKMLIRKESSWTISNIAAGNPQQIAKIIEIPEYIKALTQVFLNDAPEVVKEASWCFGNLISGSTPDQICYMMKNYDCVEILEVMLDSSNKEISEQGFETIIHILRTFDNAPEMEFYVLAFENKGLLCKVKQHPKFSSSLGESLCNFFGEGIRNSLKNHKEIQEEKGQELVKEENEEDKDLAKED